MEAPYSVNSMTNRNGQQLTDFKNQFDLIATNTCFKKCPGKLWTHIYSNGTTAQLELHTSKQKNGEIALKIFADIAPLILLVLIIES